MNESLLMHDAAFIHVQYQFAAHIRDPAHMPPPCDIEERRMAVYRELFYRNIEEALLNAFPVLRAITDDQRWHALVRDFWARHRCRTPLFALLPAEFLDYLRLERMCGSSDPPFMLELAHYEWVELALSTALGQPDGDSVGEGMELCERVVVLSPLARNLTYRFPVHRIGPGYVPNRSGGPTHLLVYRDRNEQVKFLELNAMAARLVSAIEQNRGQTCRELLVEIAEASPQFSRDEIMTGGLQLMQELERRGVILMRSMPSETVQACDGSEP